jgi:hypothetical protein
MVLDGSGGHRPMIWRPSDMVSMVDRWWMGGFCCELCAKKYGTWYVLSHKKWRSAQLTFFNSSLSDVDVSFVNEYQYLICRAWSALSKTVLTLI